MGCKFSSHTLPRDGRSARWPPRVDVGFRTREGLLQDNAEAVLAGRTLAAAAKRSVAKVGARSLGPKRACSVLCSRVQSLCAEPVGKMWGAFTHN